MESNDVIQVNYKILDKIFPTVKGVDKSKLLITNVGMYSVSKVKGATMLCNIIRKHLSTNNVTVTDATGNVGSDTIMLGLHFSKVNSIELDQDQYYVLQHNVKTYNMEDKITVYNGDSLTIIPELKQDVIFIDAPWTGRDYKKHERLSLFMSDKELSTVYKELINHCKFMIFKVPVNYDITFFMQNSNVKRMNIYSYMKHDKISYYFLLCF